MEPKRPKHHLNPRQEKAAVDGQKARAQPNLDTDENEARRQWIRKDLNTI